MSSPFSSPRNQQSGDFVQRPLRPGGIRPPLASVPEKRAIANPRLRSKSPQPNHIHNNNLFKDIDITSADLHKTLRSQLKQYTVDEFVLIDKVHLAGDSAVFKSLNKRDGKLYALKQRTSSELGRYADILHEAKLNLEHPHIVRCFGAFWGAKYALSMVFEWADGGDLLTLIKQRRQRQKPIAELDVWRWSKQLFSALELLHSRRIIHRDIKCSNLLLFSNSSSDQQLHINSIDKETRGARIEPPLPPPVDPFDKPSAFDIRVADLGVARKLGNGPGSDFATTLFGTPLYMSPELVDPTKGPRYTNKTDIWSSGVTIYEMAALISPFSGHSMAQLTHAVRSGRYRPLPPLYSKELSSFISKCLSVDPDKRPDSKTAFQICSAMEAKLSGTLNLLSSSAVVGSGGGGVLGNAATEPGMLEARRAEAISAHRREKSYSNKFSSNISPCLDVIDQNQDYIQRPFSAPTLVPVGTYAANVLQSQAQIQSDRALQYHDRNSAGDPNLPLVARAKALAAESKRISEAARNRSSLLYDQEQRHLLGNISPPPVVSGPSLLRGVELPIQKSDYQNKHLDSTQVDLNTRDEQEVNELMVAQRLDSRIKADEGSGVTRVRVSRKAKEAAAIAASNNHIKAIDNSSTDVLNIGNYQQYKKQREGYSHIQQPFKQEMFERNEYEVQKLSEKNMNEQQQQRPKTAPSLRNQPIHSVNSVSNQDSMEQKQQQQKQQQQQQQQQQQSRSPLRYQQQLLLMGGGDSVQARSPKVANSPVLPLTVDVVHALKLVKEKEKKEKESADYFVETERLDQLAYMRAHPVTSSNGNGRKTKTTTTTTTTTSTTANVPISVSTLESKNKVHDLVIQNQSRIFPISTIDTSHPMQPEIHSLANEIRFGNVQSKTRPMSSPVKHMNNADLYLADIINKDPKATLTGFKSLGVDYHKSGNKRDGSGSGSGSDGLNCLLRENENNKIVHEEEEDEEGEEEEEEDQVKGVKKQDNVDGIYSSSSHVRIGMSRKVEEEIATRRRALVERNKEIWRKQLLRAGHVPKE